MNSRELSEDKLNLYIDGQLDKEEMDEIRQSLLEDKDLREQVCQLRAVRELVGYAYSEVPESQHDTPARNKSASFFKKAAAASVVLVTGVLLGWTTYDYSPNAIQAISAQNTFQYIANHVDTEHGKRNIILHIDTSDLQVVNSALNEADQLLAMYRDSNTPMKLDIITNKEGINILRPDVSPYINRIQQLIRHDNVKVYACNQSLAKAMKKEGVDIVLVPGVARDKLASELIPERLKKGWVYIKA